MPEFFMVRYSTLGQLFAEEPMPWGLRGDPYLWRAMAEQFADTALPASAEALEQLIVEAFARLTGKPLSTPGHFFVEPFAHGGLSSGQVSTDFWRHSALPLLRARWAEATSEA
jgi:hypothetical protein